MSNPPNASPDNPVLGSPDGKAGEKNFSRFSPRNPLKNLDSDERIQGNPRKSNPHDRGFSQRNGAGPRESKRASQENTQGASTNRLAPSVRERLGEEKAALTQSLRVDPMADAKREMPLGRDRRASERFRRHEHRVKRNHRILVTVDEQDRRRRAARVARRRFAEMLGANQQARKAKNRRRRPRAPKADMERHHATLAEADQRQLRIVETKPLELCVQKLVNRPPRLDRACPPLPD